MKIECIKLLIDNVEKEIINCNLKDYLSIGSIYWVYGIRFTKNVTYVHIYEGNHLIEVPIQMFHILDSRISAIWNVKIWENREVTFWPELFYKDDFFENFSEHEQKERELFKRLISEIEQ